jgi:GNAT superfamily N-acetyltransferase
MGDALRPPPPMNGACFASPPYGWVSLSRRERIGFKMGAPFASVGAADLFTPEKRQELRCVVEVDDIASALAEAFDFEFSGALSFTPPAMPAPPEDYGIGLIVGPSGSGKSTLLKQFGGEADIAWDEGKSVASHFASADDARTRLGAVGLNSIPAMLRPYHVLSTGERFRADLARRVQDDAVIDEFTSVVDRTVAKSCSHALRRYVDQNEVKRLVLATCHYDIIEWLQPDWIFDTNTGQMAGRGLVQRPSIDIELVPCTTAAWPIFRPHHYLDANLNQSSRCWLAIWDGVAVGFASMIAFPNGAFQRAWREHRTVVLPDYQGLGIGVRISDAVGEMVRAEGGRLFSKTSNHRMGDYRNRSASWRPTSKNQRARADYNHDRPTKESGHKDRHTKRLCYSHEYMGAGE